MTHPIDPQRRGIGDVCHARLTALPFNNQSRTQNGSHTESIVNNTHHVLPQGDYYVPSIRWNAPNESVMPKLKQKAGEVKAHIQKHAVTIACGAPMVGKSTIVCEVLSQHRPHHVICKGLPTFDSILSHLSTCLQLDCAINKFNAAACIYDLVKKEKDTIFVFHKCEALCERDRAPFVAFLFQLYTVSNNCIKSVVTTYKQFAIPKHCLVSQMHIGLMDHTDICNFIHFYAGSNLQGVEGYAEMIIRNNLCLPLGVRHLIETYLVPGQQNDIPSADDIDRHIKKSPLQFLSKIFRDREHEVKSWVGTSKREWIALFCLNHNATSSEELLKHMTRSDGDDHMTEFTEWNNLLKTFAVFRVPGLDRLQFHPLLSYHFMLEINREIALEGMWFDISCSKMVKYLCNILCLTDEMTACVGDRAATFQCTLPELPIIKNILQMALHCSQHTFKDFCQVALVGANLMVKWFTAESVQFFQSLYNYASNPPNGRQSQSLRRQAAILEGLMAHAIHCASGNSQKGNDWAATEGHFKSALGVLKKDGASFYLAQLYSLFARALSYQGQYSLSLEYAKEGKAIMARGFGEEMEEHISVSEGRKDDLYKRLDIILAMPLIFTGRNAEAIEILSTSLDQMKRMEMDFPTLDQVYNLLGLAIQRSNGDKRQALHFYNACLTERKFTERFSSTPLVVPLNNIAMLEMDLGNIGSKEIDLARSLLEDALDIQKKNNQWSSYYTALTLLHKSEVCLASNDLHQALEDSQLAKSILDANCNKHDLRFHLQHHMAHIRIALEQGKNSMLASQKWNHSLSPPSGPNENSSSRPDSIPLFQHTNGIVVDCNFKKVLSSCGKSLCAEAYFQNVCRLGDESKDNLSDNSHHYILSAFEHLILLNWKNLAKMNDYLEGMKRVFTEYHWMVQEFNKPDHQISQRMKDHHEFYTKIEELLLPQNNHLALSCLNQHSICFRVLKHCKACKISQKYFDTNAWLTRLYHFITEQQKERLRAAQTQSNPSCVTHDSLWGMDVPTESGREANLRPEPDSASSSTWPKAPAVGSHDIPVSSPQALRSQENISPYLLNAAEQRNREISPFLNALLVPSLTSGHSSTVQKSNHDNATSVENPPDDLKDNQASQLVIVQSKAQEESTDYNCDSMNFLEKGNQTYVHVSEQQSTTVGTPAMTNGIEALSELDDNWRRTHRTYLSPNFSSVPNTPTNCCQSGENNLILHQAVSGETYASIDVEKSLSASFVAASAVAANQRQPEKVVFTTSINEKEDSESHGSNSNSDKSAANELHVSNLPAQSSKETPNNSRKCSSQSSQSHGGARPKTQCSVVYPNSQKCNTAHLSGHRIAHGALSHVQSIGGSNFQQNNPNLNSQINQQSDVEQQFSDKSPIESINYVGSSCDAGQSPQGSVPEGLHSSTPNLGMSTRKTLNPTESQGFVGGLVKLRCGTFVGDHGRSRHVDTLGDTNSFTQLHHYWKATHSYDSGVGVAMHSALIENSLLSDGPSRRIQHVGTFGSTVKSEDGSEMEEREEVITEYLAQRKEPVEHDERISG